MEEQSKRQDLAKKKYQAYKEFFTSDVGEEILTDLMKAAGFRNTSVGKDPYETYFNEGRRSIVLDIIATAKLTPKQINKLTKKMHEQDEYLI